MIETALRLLDEVGLDGLTVRRLAAELGVQSPAPYWHIRGKQELLDGMADAIVVAAGMGPPRDGEPWQDWLARIATISQYVNGFVLLEQARPREPTENPTNQLADLLDTNTPAPLLEAIREGGTTTGDDAFEHGLRTLIEGTTATLTGVRGGLRSWGAR